MDLFSNLEKMGITGLENMDIFESPASMPKTAAEVKKQAIVKPDEADMVFEKTVNCVVCGKAFKSLTVKSGKARIIARDKDLRPIFDGFEASKYDVISCPYCGFSALTRYFTPLATVQKKLVLEKISSHVKPFDVHNTKIDYEEALSRYELALVNSVVKMSKLSERAYTCLKIGWLYRGYAVEMKEAQVADDSVITELEKKEDAFLKKAYEGLTKAVLEEEFPMCGMDEYTVDYILAALAMRFGDDSVAKKLVSEILVSKSASAGIKDKARDLKEELIK